MTMKRKSRKRVRFNPMTYFVRGVQEESQAVKDGHPTNIGADDIAEIYGMDGAKLKAFVRGWRSAASARRRK